METIILDRQTLQVGGGSQPPAATKTELPPIKVRSEAELDAELQAAISQLELLIVGDTQYLSADKALETAAAILLGVQGIETEEDYLDVQEALDRVCAICGFSGEIELNPPTVTFNNRGRYRQKIEIDSGLIPTTVQDLLSGHTTLMGTPYHFIPLGRVIDRIANPIFGKEKYRLNAGELKFLELAISAAMIVDEWQTVSGRDEDGTGRYLSDIEQYLKKSLKPDFEGFERSAGAFITLRGEERLSKAALKQAGCRGAFAQNVTSDPDSHIPNLWWRTILKKNGYMSTCRDGDDWIYPIPLDVPDNIDELIYKAIMNCVPRTATGGKLKGMQYLLTHEIIFNLANEMPEWLPALKNDDRFEKLLDSLEKETGWKKALAKAGYAPKQKWIFKGDVGSKIEAPHGQNKQVFACYKRLGAIPKEVQEIALADGLRVKCLDLTRDTGNNLVYMRMIGPRSSVNANWAVVRGRRSIYCLDGILVPPAKASALTLKRVLPETGWDDWVIIHHQASLEKMIPGQPFYCTGEGYNDSEEENDSQAINLLDNFFMRLTKSLSAPLLQTWASYLWSEGVTAELISPLENNCHGLFFWQVEPNEEKWGEIVQQGLKSKQIEIRL